MRAAVLLLIAASVFFYQTGRRDLSDFRYMLLVSHGLWHHADASLDAWAPPPHGSEYARPVAETLPYQFVVREGRVHHAFPIGTALLLTPIVGLAESVGITLLDEHGDYDAKREARIQHGIASIAMGVLVALFLLQARLLLGPLPSLAIASAAGLATQVWSVSAGTLWSHTFAILLLGAALYLLLRAELRDTVPPLAWVGTLLAWMFVVRPTSAIPITALTAWALWRWGRGAWPLVASGGLWLAIFLLLSLALYGQLLPPYYRVQQLNPWPSLDALLGNLVSPARGVLIYVPVLLYLGALLRHGWPRLQARGLVSCGLVTCALHWWVISCFPHWWGGHCWGPRLMTDLVPWWVLFAIVGQAALREEAGARQRPPWLHPGIAAALLGIGVLLNGIWVRSNASAGWNHRVEVDRHPEKLWDWRDPPFLGWRRADRRR